MKYVEEILSPGEQIMTASRLHWIVFLDPIAFVVIGAVLVVYSSIVPDSPVLGLPYLSLVVIALGILSEGQAVVVYQTTEFAITNKRIIAKSGWLHRKSRDILLGKVESINVDQTFLGRLLGYDSLMIIGTGGTKEFFPNIARVIDFQSAINAQVSRMR
jgi:uncharacterized membrane protein YdbT with pleckstrin-like domain